MFINSSQKSRPACPSTSWVIIPQAVRVVIPPVTNDFIALFKDTSVCSVVAVVELTGGYRQLVVANPGQILHLAAHHSCRPRTLCECQTASSRRCRCVVAGQDLKSPGQQRVAAQHP